MKVCSFLPAATHMIYEMGLQEYLYGVTFECPSDKPVVVHSYLGGKHYSSNEIEELVSAKKQRGESLYYVDEDLLQEIAPDVIFTQDVCDVCQIGTSYAMRAISKLEKQPQIIPLIPRNLNDVFQNAITIAQAMEREEAAYSLLTKLQKRMNSMLDTLRQKGAPLRRVMVMEWIDPVYNCGHWIPYQIAKAGGVDMLSNPSGYSIITSWEKVRSYDPEVIVIAPCGFDITRTAEEAGTLTARPGWNKLSAVRNDRVFIADANLFTRPSTSLVDGIELLAALFHPKLFEVPEKLSSRVVSLNEIPTRS